MRAWPRSLFGRIAGILLLGLAAAYALAFWSVVRERGELAQSMMLGYVGRDVASSVATLDRLQPAERAAWLPRLSRPNYQFTLGASAAPSAPATALATQIASAIGAEIGADRMLGVASAGDSTLLRLRLADGSPLTLQLQAPRRMISTGTAALLLAQLAALGLCLWWAVRIATRPLSQLAGAADRLGADPQAPPLPEQGPQELQRAAAAFNAMQRRIADHLAERLRILAAISHDLQTPITRMRVRTDLLVDDALRDRLQADLQEMQHMVEEGLAYARSAHAAVEPARAVDLQALLDGLVCDYVDAGHGVTLSGTCNEPVTTRPQALKRVMTNLVDNALKFAGAAELAIEPDPQGLAIIVRDRGPGIAPDQLAAVMLPFVRLETSRSRETGGTGLGLAIVQQLAAALHARLVLANRAGGGLEARLVLPPPDRVSKTKARQAAAS